MQLQSDFAPWKTILTPVDRDRLDLEQAFALLTEPIGDGTAGIRLVGNSSISTGVSCPYAMDRTCANHGMPPGPITRPV